jgi:hypothetical protein
MSVKWSESSQEEALQGTDVQGSDREKKNATSLEQ